MSPYNKFIPNDLMFTCSVEKHLTLDIVIAKAYKLKVYKVPYVITHTQAQDSIKLSIEFDSEVANNLNKIRNHWAIKKQDYHAESTHWVLHRDYEDLIEIMNNGQYS